MGITTAAGITVAGIIISANRVLASSRRAILIGG